MKRFIIILSVFVFLSGCSLEDDNANDFEFQVMPIESVNMANSFVKGNTYVISMTYTAPSSCYEFYNFSYQVQGHERTIAVVNTVYNDPTCEIEPKQVEVSMDFMVTGDDVYVFKFFQGIDEEGEDHYYVVEVPVIE
jgi:hypothetical protein